MMGIGTNVVGSWTISLKKNCCSRVRFSARQLNSPECSFMTTGDMMKPAYVQIFMHKKKNKIINEMEGSDGLPSVKPAVKLRQYLHIQC
jgi:hypothetical protein